MKRFQFTYIGWVASYGDFDVCFTIVKADSEEEARMKFNQTNRFIKSDVAVEELT